MCQGSWSGVRPAQGNHRMWCNQASLWTAHVVHCARRRARAPASGKAAPRRRPRWRRTSPRWRRRPRLWRRWASCRRRSWCSATRTTPACSKPPWPRCSPPKRSARTACRAQLHAATDMLAHGLQPRAHRGVTSSSNARGFGPERMTIRDVSGTLPLCAGGCRLLGAAPLAARPRQPPHREGRRARRLRQQRDDVEVGCAAPSPVRLCGPMRLARCVCRAE